MAHGGKKLGFGSIRHFRPFPGFFRRGQGLVPGCLKVPQVPGESIEAFLQLPGFAGSAGKAYLNFLVFPINQFCNPTGQAMDR